MVPDDLIGQVIDGRYEVRAKLGQGGMGAVYRAWQASVEREVAIKVIHRAFSRDPIAVTRFEREARLASKLSQPNTVSVLDSGHTTDGRLFLAMELIKGRTLHAVLVDAGVFGAERVARVGVQMCDALEAAHALGIVHRDLKLENVIVLDDPPGRDLIKVLDFGLAKVEGDMRGTAAGMVVGTPRYIAPEVAHTGIAVAASDMYAFGVILCELATGAAPWVGDNLTELLKHKLDPSPVVASVPPALRGLVAALLDPSPERRPTAAVTREMLSGAPHGHAYEVRGPASLPEARTMAADAGPSAPVRGEGAPARKRWRWSRFIAVVAVVVAIVAVAFAISAGRSGGSDDAWAEGSAALPAPPATSAGTVRFHVTTKPAGARVRVLIKHAQMIEAGFAPVDIDVPRGTEEVQVVARHRGLRRSTYAVPDHDRTIELQLPEE
jgi:hypothetical protein